MAYPKLQLNSTSPSQCSSLFLAVFGIILILAGPALGLWETSRGNYYRNNQFSTDHLLLDTTAEAYFSDPMALNTDFLPNVPTVLYDYRTANSSQEFLLVPSIRLFTPVSTDYNGTAAPPYRIIESNLYDPIVNQVQGGFWTSVDAQSTFFYQQDLSPGWDYKASNVSDGQYITPYLSGFVLPNDGGPIELRMDSDGQAADPQYFSNNLFSNQAWKGANQTGSIFWYNSFFHFSKSNKTYIISAESLANSGIYNLSANQGFPWTYKNLPVVIPASSGGSGSGSFSSPNFNVGGESQTVYFASSAGIRKISESRVPSFNLNNPNLYSIVDQTPAFMFYNPKDFSDYQLLMSENKALLIAFSTNDIYLMQTDGMIYGSIASFKDQAIIDACTYYDSTLQKQALLVATSKALYLYTFPDTYTTPVQQTTLATGNFCAVYTQVRNGKPLYIAVRHDAINDTLWMKNDQNAAETIAMPKRASTRSAFGTARLAFCNNQICYFYAEGTSNGFVTMNIWLNPAAQVLPDSPSTNINLLPSNFGGNVVTAALFSDHTFNFKIVPNSNNPNQLISKYLLRVNISSTQHYDFTVLDENGFYFSVTDLAANYKALHINGNLNYSGANVKDMIIPTQNRCLSLQVATENDGTASSKPHTSAWSDPTYFYYDVNPPSPPHNLSISAGASTTVIGTGPAYTIQGREVYLNFTQASDEASVPGYVGKFLIGDPLIIDKYLVTTTEAGSKYVTTEVAGKAGLSTAFNVKFSGLFSKGPTSEVTIRAVDHAGFLSDPQTFKLYKYVSQVYLPGTPEVAVNPTTDVVALSWDPAVSPNGLPIQTYNVAVVNVKDNVYFNLTTTEAQLITKLGPSYYTFQVKAYDGVNWTPYSYRSDYVTVTGRFGTAPKNLLPTAIDPGSVHSYAEYANIYFATTNHDPIFSAAKVPSYYVNSSQCKLKWSTPDLVDYGGMKNQYLYANQFGFPASMQVTQLSGNTREAQINGSESEYQYALSAMDQAGWETAKSTPSVEVVFDSTDPVIQSDTGALDRNHGYVTTNPATCNWYFSDQPSGMWKGTLTFYEENHPTQLITLESLICMPNQHGKQNQPLKMTVPFHPSFSPTGTYAVDGNYYWQVQAYDLAGRMATNSYSYSKAIVDTQKPTGTMTIVRTPRPTINLTASDNLSGIDTVRIGILNSTGTTTITTETIYDSSHDYSIPASYQVTKTLDPGSYIFILTMIDKANNPNAINQTGVNIGGGLSTTFYATAEKDGYSSDLGQGYLTEESIVYWNYYLDADQIDPSTIKLASYEVDGGVYRNYPLGSTPHQLRLGSLIDLSTSGAHKLTVFAANANRTGVSTFEFNYDQQAPIAADNADTFSAYTLSAIDSGSRNADFAATVTDNFSGLYSVSLVATADALPVYAQFDQDGNPIGTGTQGQVQHREDGTTYNGEKSADFKASLTDLTLNYTWHYALTLIDQAGKQRVYHGDIFSAPYNIAQVAVSPTTATLELNSYLTLVATAFAADQTAYNLNDFVWSISGSGNGELSTYGTQATFRATKEGTAVIGVFSQTNPNKTAQAQVIINPRFDQTAATLEISGDGAIAVGNKVSYTGSIKNADGIYLDPAAYTWQWQLTPTEPSFTFTQNQASFTSTTAKKYVLSATVSGLTRRLSIEASDYSGYLISFSDGCPNTIKAGDTLDLTPYLAVKDRQGNATNNFGAIQWTVSPAGQGQVSAGIFTAPQAAGKKATVTAALGQQTAVQTFDVVSAVPERVFVVPSATSFLVMSDDRIKFNLLYVDKFNNLVASSEVLYKAANTGTAPKTIPYTIQDGLYTAITKPQVSIVVIPKGLIPTISSINGGNKLTPGQKYQVAIDTFGAPASAVTITGLSFTSVNGINYEFVAPTEGNYSLSVDIKTSAYYDETGNYVATGHKLFTSRSFMSSLPPRITLKQEANGITTTIQPEVVTYIARDGLLSFYVEDNNRVMSLEYHISNLDGNQLSGAASISVNNTVTMPDITIQSDKISLASAANLQAGDHDIIYTATAVDAAGDSTLQNYQLKISDSAKIEGPVLCAPNPTSGKTDLMFQLTAPSKVNFYFYTLTGSLINRASGDFPAGINKKNFDFSTLANGTYLGVLTVNNQSYKVEVVVLR